jgi:hypothetical protein
VQVPTSRPAQATPIDDINFVVAAHAMPVSGNLSGSKAESWSSDGGEFGSSFSWTEESSNEDLDYFVALDMAAAKSLPQPEVREVSAPQAMAIIEERRRRRVVSKHNVGEMSRSGRRRRMGMERSRLRLDRGGQRDLLSSTSGTCIGEGDLQNLFEGEELKMMMFNFCEAGLIPKAEPM